MCIAISLMILLLAVGINGGGISLYRGQNGGGGTLAETCLTETTIMSTLSFLQHFEWSDSND